jgi:hypothetical protein
MRRRKAETPTAPDPSDPFDDAPCFDGEKGHEEEEPKDPEPGMQCSVCHGAVYQRPGGIVCLQGHGGAEEVSPVKPPEVKRGKSLDEMLESVDKKNGSRSLSFPAGFGPIVEHAMTIDVGAEYERLRAGLELGDRRHEYGPVMEALDRVERDTVAARRLYRAAVVAHEAFEIDAREQIAALREKGRLALQEQKNEGTRSKAITNDDVEDWCVENFGDAWRAVSEKRAKLKGTAEVLGELAEAYRSRQATVRMLAERVAPRRA